MENLEVNIVTEMFVLILCGILGFQFITIIDRVWFSIDYKKAEKGLEVLEHYHYKFPLWIIAFVIFEYSPALSFGLIGMGSAFFYHETKQKNYFAHNSPHFKGSTIIGIALGVITIITYILVFGSVDV